MARMSWVELCQHADFRGRWVALDGCTYDKESGRATEGSVVDVDDDLVDLCARIQDSEHKNCAILFCGEEDPREPEGDSDPFEHSAH